jgi:LuxR family maltose regulon positive regulatory protein
LLIAKITRPRFPEVLPRKRLFGLIDKGRRVPVTWVSGPGGSGKTTLIASYLDEKKIPGLWYQLDEGDGDIATFFYYMGLAAKKAAPRFKKPLPLLTAEYLFGVPTFTKRYFENLYSRLKPHSVMVLDNCQQVASNSPFHEVLRNALSVIPEGINVIVSSRGAPPANLALLSTYNRIHYIGWDNLKFDMSETGALIRSTQTKAQHRSIAGQLLRITEGWAAGLVLLMEHLRTFGLSPHEIERFKPGELFDYFTTEIFEKTDPDTQVFLLKTSFLPRISPHAARKLTGNDNSGTLLAALSRSHFFTERRSVADPVYQYHPLFREFLQSRAQQTYSGDEIRGIMRLAGQLLEEAGEVEDAAELWSMSEEWEGLVRLILTNAASMASQGRSQPVERWLKCIPEHIRDSNPWLLYWLGVCRMPFALPEGQRHFERALELFRKQPDPAGVYLAWSGAVEAVYQEMVDIGRLAAWIALFDELVKEHGLPPPEVEPQVAIRIFAALPWRHDNPMFVLWNKKALAILDSDKDAGLRMLAGFYLFLYHVWWAGNYVTGRQVLDVMRRIAGSRQDLPPLIQTMQKSAEALFDLLMGAHERCVATVEEGLSLANGSGVHIWDNIFLMTGAGTSLCARDTARAAHFLDRMASTLEGARVFDMIYFHHKSSWRLMLMNDIPQAVVHVEKALAFASKSGFEIAQAQAHFLAAHLMRKTGERRKAKEHIQQCRDIGRLIGSAIVEFMSLLSEAAYAFDEKDEEAGLAYLKDAMALGRSNGYVYFCGWHASLLLPLCVKALEAGIETEYVGDLIRKCRLVPEDPPFHIETWPWAVKIYTLGRFEIVMNGRPLRFTGKVQKKPLEMLKILIALGGQNVSEHRFIDALWPEADGDTSYITFKSTLHRLRKLLGGEELIELREGMMSLDRRSCWVDAWAFERILDDTGRENRQSDPYGQSLEKAAAMYRGHFLGEDSDRPWAASPKERLRGKFLRTVDNLAEYWMERVETTEAASKQISQPAIKKATECLERGLEIDDTAEEFYQNLIICHQKLGNKAEAVKVYERCRDTLSASLGVAPSEKTHLLYKKTTGNLP